MTDLDIKAKPLPAAPQIIRRAPPPVFIHAAPRTSSTWFWSKFREHPSTLCFCEPFNPALGWITPKSASTLDRTSWDSRHSPTEPYYREYLTLIRESGGVELFDRAMEFQWFIPLGGLRGELRQSEEDYLSLLLRQSGDAGKVPVLKFTRSLGRLWAIRNSFGGFHVFLHRNLWRQWLSYLYYARRANQHFYETTARIVSRSDDPFLAGVADFYVTRALDFRRRGDDNAHQPAPGDESLGLLLALPESHAFAMFMALHIYLYLHAQSCAELTVDVTKVASDSGYRSHIETELARQTGLEISLPDVADEQRDSGVAIGAGAIDWGEIREHARFAVQALTAFADPTALMQNASAFIDSAIEEMYKSEAALAMRSDAAEEIWFARLQEARCHWALGDGGGFVQQALALFNERPNRAEPLFDLARFHRERGMHETAVHFAEAGLALGRPGGDANFVEDFVYQSGLQEELSISAYYCRDPARRERGAAACNWLAVNRDIPASTREWARQNLSFYSGLAGKRSSGKPDTLYTGGFFDSQAAGSLESARVILREACQLYRPQSVIDIGCGVGSWLRAAFELGVGDLLGLDGEYVPREKLLISPANFRSCDLEGQSLKETASGRRFDLVICAEVAEHLSPERAPSFIDELCALGDAVLFSAAVPGQGGTGHVNERWPDYWGAHFARNGFACFDSLRPRLWDEPRIEFWYLQNILFFARRGTSAFEALMSAGTPTPCPRPLIHPRSGRPEAVSVVESSPAPTGGRPDTDRKLLPIHVISLDRTPARFAEFQRRNAHLRHFTRFPAVDGRKLDREELIREGIMTADCGYTAGCLGCALSHFALWRKVIEEGRAITVAEDDAIFSRNFAERSREFLEGLPTDWDFVQWGWVFKHYLWVHVIPQVVSATMTFYQDELRQNIEDFQTSDVASVPVRLRHSFGTVCYSVSPRGARALLDHCTPLTGKLIEFPGST